MYTKLLIVTTVVLIVAAMVELLLPHGPAVADRVLPPPTPGASALDAPIDRLVLEGRSLTDALDSMRGKSAANMVIDWDQLPDPARLRQTPIFAALHHVSAGTALATILWLADSRLSFGFDDGVFVIAPDWRHALKNVRIYDVRDLLPSRSDAVAKEEFIDAVRPFIADDQTPWNIHATVHAGELIVRETPVQHRRIGALLQQFRNRGCGWPDEPTARILRAPMTPIRWQSISLRQALENLAAALNCSIAVDWKSIAAIARQRVMVDVGVQPHHAAGALDALTSAVNKAVGLGIDDFRSLDWRARDGVVFISTRAVLRHHPMPRVHDVRAIAAGPNGPQKLVARLTTSVEPSSWFEGSARGGIVRCWNGRLIVSGSPELQGKVAVFLAGIK